MALRVFGSVALNLLRPAEPYLGLIKERSYRDLVQEREALILRLTNLNNELQRRIMRSVIMAHELVTPPPPPTRLAQVGAGLLLLLMTAGPAVALQATLTWTNPTDANRTGLRVERQDSAAGAFANQTPTPLSANITTFNQSGLATNVQYCYRVIAIGAGGDAPTPWPTVCGTPAGAPMNVGGITIIFAP